MAGNLSKQLENLISPNVGLLIDVFFFNLTALASMYSILIISYLFMVFGIFLLEYFFSVYLSFIFLFDQPCGIFKPLWHVGVLN